MNFFRSRPDNTQESAETYWLEVYVHDFEAFMEKSHLSYWRTDPFQNGIGVYIGYILQPHKDSRWLYAMVGESLIAGGLRVRDLEIFDALAQQKADITPYFRDFPASLDFKRGDNYNSYIGITRYNINPTDVSDRAEQFYFLRHTLEILDLALRDRVADLQ